MATKPDVRIKKPSTAMLAAAGMLMEETYEAFTSSQLAFALMIYEAGNLEKESFCMAMREAMKGSWRSWNGRIKISDAGAKNLFARIEHLSRQASDARLELC